ncbi:GNAT family N-acetyltransferase [Janibacter sp. DB-40]|uniref:GNAT family N-acetyltransferase n=1 Tax=Janibacter sp. DB-40 TaxID=3028808 RepID=UPI0024073356|nr:GNAT family N-acetyltransferase [Janibacter sp. DB-40]
MPTADASVRAAGPNDAPAVGQVQALVWQEAYDGVVPPQVHAAFDPQSFTAAWRDSLRTPPEGVHRLLVACAGEQVVGFVAIGPSQDPDTGQTTGEVTALGVHPMHRRQGHGSRLLNAAVDLLRDAGAEHVAAWCLVQHEDVRAFLTGSGLSPDGAYRDRVISPDGETAREVRLVALLTQDAQ